MIYHCKNRPAAFAVYLSLGFLAGRGNVSHTWWEGTLMDRNGYSRWLVETYRRVVCDTFFLPPVIRS